VCYHSQFFSRIFSFPFSDVFGERCIYICDLRLSLLSSHYELPLVKRIAENPPSASSIGDGFFLSFPGVYSVVKPSFHTPYPFIIWNTVVMCFPPRPSIVFQSFDAPVLLSLSPFSLDFFCCCCELTFDLFHSKEIWSRVISILASFIKALSGFVLPSGR